MNDSGERQALFRRTGVGRKLLCDESNDEMDGLAGVHASGVEPVIRGQINGPPAVSREDREIKQKFLRRFSRLTSNSDSMSSSARRFVEMIGIWIPAGSVMYITPTSTSSGPVHNGCPASRILIG